MKKIIYLGDHLRGLVPSFVCTKTISVREIIKEGFEVIVLSDEYELTHKEFRLLRAFNIQVYGGGRFDKLYQSEILDSLGIKTIPYFFSNGYEGTLKAFIESKIQSEEWIVKIGNGARGLGQLKIKNEDIRSLLDDIFYNEKTLSSISNNKKEYIRSKITRTSDSNSLLKNDEPYLESESYKYNSDSRLAESMFSSAFKNEKILIQKYIPFEKEYRVLYFFNAEPIIVERITAPDSWQANSCIEGAQRIIDYKGDLNKIHPNVKKDIDKIMGTLNTPWLSFDIGVYNGTYYFIEFQQEFGWIEISAEELYKRIEKTLTSLNDG